MKRGDREWYLYHHIDNEKPIIPLILLSCFLFICHNGIVWISITWICYFTWASKNNRKLDNDPEIQQARRICKESKERLNLK